MAKLVILKRILLSSFGTDAEWWVIKQDAATTACKLMDILQMHRRRQGPEKATQKTGMSCCGTSTVLVIIFISLCVTPVKSSVNLLFSPINYCFLHFLTFFLSLPSLHLARSLRSRDSGLESEGYCGMQGPAQGLDQSALQWFLLFGVCVFPEKLLVCRLPPCPPSKTQTRVHIHTHTHTYSGCQPKSSLNQSELQIYQNKSQNPGTLHKT